MGAGGQDRTMTQDTIEHLPEFRCLFTPQIFFEHLVCVDRSCLRHKLNWAAVGGGGAAVTEQSPSSLGSSLPCVNSSVAFLIEGRIDWPGVSVEPSPN